MRESPSACRVNGYRTICSSTQGLRIVTDCNYVPASASIRFSAFGRQLVDADFNGGQISSDGGALLPREDERAFKLVRRLTACIADCAWVGAADRAATFKPLAMARGFQKGGRAVDGGGVTPQQSEIRVYGVKVGARSKSLTRSLRGTNLNRRRKEPVFSEPDEGMKYAG